jgi:hypothetical protein
MTGIPDDVARREQDRDRFVMVLEEFDHGDQFYALIRTLR